MTNLNKIIHYAKCAELKKTLYLLVTFSHKIDMNVKTYQGNEPGDVIDNLFEGKEPVNETEAKVSEFSTTLNQD